jgi:hypothetical protein
LLVIQTGEMRAFGTVQSIVAERPELAGLGLEDLFLVLTGADAPPRPMTPPIASAAVVPGDPYGPTGA